MDDSDVASFNDSSEEEPAWSDEDSNSAEERNDIGLSDVQLQEQGLHS